MNFRKEFTVVMRVLPQLFAHMGEEANVKAWSDFQARIAAGQVFMEYGRPVYNPGQMGVCEWFARVQQIDVNRVCAILSSAELDLRTDLIHATVCPYGPLAGPLEVLLEKQEAGGGTLPFGMRAMTTRKSTINQIVTFDALPEGFGDPQLHREYVESINRAWG